MQHFGEEKVVGEEEASAIPWKYRIQEEDQHRRAEVTTMKT
jgi:hypothetical protein